MDAMDAIWTLLYMDAIDATDAPWMRHGSAHRGYGAVAVHTQLLRTWSLLTLRLSTLPRVVMISWVHYQLGARFIRRPRVSGVYWTIKRVELNTARPLSESLVAS